MNNFNHYSQSQEYIDAKQAEQETLICLQRQGFDARESTQQEQYDDIDLVIKDFTGKPITISVKHQTKGFNQYGNYFFEHMLNGKDGWFLSGKSDVTAIKVNNEIQFYISKNLKDRVLELFTSGKIQSKGLTARQNATNAYAQTSKGYCCPAFLLQDLIFSTYTISDGILTMGNKGI